MKFHKDFPLLYSQRIFRTTSTGLDQTVVTVASLTAILEPLVLKSEVLSVVRKKPVAVVSQEVTLGNNI